MEKLHEYQGLAGRLHEWRDGVLGFWTNVKEKPQNIVELARTTANDQLKGNVSAAQDFSHIYRHKTRMELIRISSAVMGIEFSYAAETAFVSPTLLQIGVEHQHMTLVWALSPLVGFFLCPILGSMSDRCKLNMGRRRPFIIFLSIGVIIGLLLVPNGEDLGYLFGDVYPKIQIGAMNLTTNLTHHQNSEINTTTIQIQKTSHPWGIFFTVLGTVLLDFDADACQSPARAYLLDVCLASDHARGLSTFTIMAGLGGFMGYSMGGINWDATYIGRRLGGHVKAVFTLITFIFVTCVAFTITSFKEVPLWILTGKVKPSKKSVHLSNDNLQNYGSLDIDEKHGHTQNVVQVAENGYLETETQIGFSISTNSEDDISLKSETLEINNSEPVQSLSHYLLSIVYMPYSLRMICLTNLFCWMAHVCYSLYFTDFVGEAVFNGDPKAPNGSLLQMRYEEGVRFGCWGMAMYSLSCACYSLIIEKLIQRYR